MMWLIWHMWVLLVLAALWAEWQAGCCVGPGLKGRCGCPAVTSLQARRPRPPSSLQHPRRRPSLPKPRPCNPRLCLTSPEQTLLPGRMISRGSRGLARRRKRRWPRPACSTSTRSPHGALPTLTASTRCSKQRVASCAMTGWDRRGTGERLGAAPVLRAEFRLTPPGSAGGPRNHVCRSARRASAGCCMR